MWLLNAQKLVRNKRLHAGRLILATLRVWHARQRFHEELAAAEEDREQDENYFDYACGHAGEMGEPGRGVNHQGYFTGHAHDMDMAATPRMYERVTSQASNAHLAPVPRFASTPRLAKIIHEEGWSDRSGTVPPGGGRGRAKGWCTPYASTRVVLWTEIIQLLASFSAAGLRIICQFLAKYPMTVLLLCSSAVVRTLGDQFAHCCFDCLCILCILQSHRNSGSSFRTIYLLPRAGGMSHCRNSGKRM